MESSVHDDGLVHGNLIDCVASERKISYLSSRDRRLTHYWLAHLH